MSDTPRTDAVYFKPHAIMYDLASEAKLLERELNAANQKINRLENDYSDLILQVERKFDNETRHQTAKRYIQNAEQQFKIESQKAKQ